MAYKVPSYEDWFEDEGHKIVDDILGWLDDAPKGIDVTDFTGRDLEEFAHEAARDIYDSLQCDYDDYLYDCMRDEAMLEGMEY